MGIDGIGKGRGTGPSTDSIGKAGSGGGAREVTGTTGGSAPFRVERPASNTTESAAAASSTDGAGGVSPALARLRAGEVDVNGYMDLRVEEATRGLEGLQPAQLAEIKRVLRDRMATDPGLADLVTRATGQTPSPPED